MMRRLWPLLALGASCLAFALLAFLLTSGPRLAGSHRKAPAGEVAPASARHERVRGLLRPGPQGGVFFHECGKGTPAWVVDETSGDLTRRWTEAVSRSPRATVFVEAQALSGPRPPIRFAAGCDRQIAIAIVERLVPEGDGARCGP
jgi:hypothetical protein